jgi:hypothetical protein
MVYPPRTHVTVPTPKEARRGSTVVLAALTTGAGVLSAVAAASASGPFAGLRPATAHFASSQIPATPMDAHELYPAPTPAVIHKVVDMYDLPAVPRAPISAPQPVENEHSSYGLASGARTGEGDSKDKQPGAQPSPQAHSTPSPSPSPGGGGDE